MTAEKEVTESNQQRLDGGNEAIVDRMQQQQQPPGTTEGAATGSGGGADDEEDFPLPTGTFAHIEAGARPTAAYAASIAAAELAAACGGPVIAEAPVATSHTTTTPTARVSHNNSSNNNTTNNMNTNNTHVLSDLPLEWTQMGSAGPVRPGTTAPADRLRFPADVTDLSLLAGDPDTEELILVGTAGQKITHMGNDLSRQFVNPAGLRQLILRSHLIRKMEGMEHFTGLELLELYDNQIEYLTGLSPSGENTTLNETVSTSTEEVTTAATETENTTTTEGTAEPMDTTTTTTTVTEGDNKDTTEANNSNKLLKRVRFPAPPPTQGVGKTLRVLDMSYNVIRDMEPVKFCPQLEELYLANNKLKVMAGLSGLSRLRKIDLGANRIRVMEPDELAGLCNLEELWLGKNKIEVIQGLENLTKLRRLDIQSNRLTVIENLTTQVSTLEELYLAHNGITTEGAMHPTGLAQEFTVLNVLDLSRNRLTHCHPFAHLTTLEELWLSGNKVATMEDVQPLQQLVALETIYLEYNPLQEDPLYRKKLAQCIPNLKQIDATMIGGLAAHGIPPPSSSAAALTGDIAGGTSMTNRWVETEEERLRRLQDMVIERARAETERMKQAAATAGATAESDRSTTEEEKSALSEEKDEGAS